MTINLIAATPSAGLPVGFFDVIWCSGYGLDIVATAGFDSLMRDDHNAL